ncbi:hypothetical protein L9F63_017176 [Diploptera punctata]|uniref:Glycoprotein-N-acetylgalactosamine 3-beta-galactosyltransferase 1-like n=1 Tax=Diploptera punctata TaxID=6984 RepID=A0AAD8A060_DIPPU|nr:hypothetical protein L9F63_017176 [Diploptera punctata]
MLRRIYTFEKSVFSIGVLIGVIIACLLIKSENETSIATSCQIRDSSIISYNDWFLKKDLKRYMVDYDLLSYGKNEQQGILESSFLYDSVRVLCVVFVTKGKNANAIRNTWGRQCNRLVFFSTENITDISVIQLKPKSSWHYLCDAIRYIWGSYGTDVHWILFAPDDLYVIPENLRYYIAHLDYNRTYYLGNDIIFWGQLYNDREAGYVLSIETIKLLQRKFNSSELCLKSGRYWKNDDFYLGKHLSEMGIYPIDTKDNNGCARFHRYNLNYVGAPHLYKSPINKFIKQMNAGCFSEHTITYNGIESDKFYLYYYLLYHVKVFSHGGILGNYPPNKTVSDDEIWKKFVRDEGIENPDLVSAKQYYELWERKIPSPDVLNAFFREQSRDAFSSDGISNSGNQQQ